MECRERDVDILRISFSPSSQAWAKSGLFGKETYVPCRMCGGTGRLHLASKDMNHG